MKKKHPESELQKNIFKWAEMLSKRFTFLRFMTSSLVGINLTIPQRVRAKAMGVKKGVPDIVLYYSANGYNGFAIELKVKPNRPTKEQKEFIKHLQNNGWYADICYSLEEFIEHFYKFLGKK